MTTNGKVTWSWRFRVSKLVTSRTLLYTGTFLTPLRVGLQ
jgi:hypothetical protein